MDLIVESDDPVLVPSGTSTPIPLGPDIVEWPYPRFFVGRYNVVLLTKNQSEELIAWELHLNAFGNWEGYASADLGSADGVQSIDYADFGLFYALAVARADGTRHVVLRDVTLSNATVDRDVFGLNLVQPSAQPTYSTVCNFDGQVVCGNMSNWQGLGTDGFAWSGIKNYAFDPLVDITAGFDVLLPHGTTGTPHTLYKLLPLDSSVIAYTDCGVCVLTPRLVESTFGWGQSFLALLGMTGATHVAGDRNIHGYIDLDNEFWLVENGGQKVTRRGYRSVIEELLKAAVPLIVSYLPLRRTFYVSNGLTTLVINDFGASTVHQGISSCIMGWDKVAYATFTDLEDRQVRVTVEATDFGVRAAKSVEDLLIGVDHDDATQVQAGTYWRSTSAMWHDPPHWRPYGPRGDIHIGVDAVEFRLAVRANEYLGTEVQTIKANLKFPDARFRRGVSAPTEGQQSSASGEAAS